MIIWKNVKERSFSSLKCLVELLSRVWLFATLRTVAHQAPPSMGFSRQEYWSGLPFPSPGESSQPRDWTRVSHIVDRCFTVWATREVLKMPYTITRRKWRSFRQALFPLFLLLTVWAPNLPPSPSTVSVQQCYCLSETATDSPPTRWPPSSSFCKFSQWVYFLIF